MNKVKPSELTSRAKRNSDAQVERAARFSRCQRLPRVTKMSVVITFYYSIELLGILLFQYLLNFIKYFS